MDKKKNEKITVAIATHNEQKNIGRCIASVRAVADEIIVVDGDSTDQTAAVAKQAGARVIKTSNKKMFHTNKQIALDAATHSWILQLDADEEVTNGLAKEILSVVNSNATYSGYRIPRKNLFVGHWLSKGGQYPDYVVRLIRNGKGHFPQKSVHEQITVEGEVGSLSEPMLHHTYDSLHEYWRKADTYTSHTADSLRFDHRAMWIIGLDFLFVKPIFTFFSIFLRHKGFIDGVWGFLFALFSSLHFPIAFYKYAVAKAA